MSGGHFDYTQYRLTEIYEEIESLIERNGKKRKRRDSWDSEYYYEYPPEVIEEFKKAVRIIKTAQVYIQRIDWLVSSDDSEESFLRRLEEELKEVNGSD